MDISKLSQSYELFFMEMQEHAIVGVVDSPFFFISALERTPPDNRRKDGNSYEEWEGVQISYFLPTQLAEVEEITIIVMVKGDDVYSFSCNLLDNKQPQGIKEGINRMYSLGVRRY